RATSSASPTIAPPMKATSDSATVQRSASSRLRRISHSVKSTIGLLSEDEARAGPVQQPAQRDRQHQVDRGADDEGLERAEVAPLDQVHRMRELGRLDL